MKYEIILEQKYKEKIFNFKQMLVKRRFKEAINIFDMNSDEERYTFVHMIKKIQKLFYYQYFMPKDKLIIPIEMNGGVYHNKIFGYTAQNFLMPDTFITLRYPDGSEEHLYPCTYFEYNSDSGLKVERNLGFLPKPNKTYKAITVGQKIKLQRGNKCEMCGWDKGNCDVHHIKPKSKGGTDDISNLIVLCPNCHRLQHAKLNKRTFL